MTKEELRKLGMGTSVPVQKIPTGQSLNLTDREWYKIVQSPTKFNPAGQAAEEAAEYEQLCEIRHEMAHDAALVGDREFAAELIGGQHDEMIRRNIRGK